MGKGSAQANINMGTFENERFPFPSVVERKKIVAILDGLHEETQRLESLYRRKLVALEELEKCLLHPLQRRALGASSPHLVIFWQGC